MVLTTSVLGRLANFRDLGGYATRSGRVIQPGLVYRCGSMHLWTAEETEAVRKHLEPKTLIDLRHETEGELFPVPTDDIGARCVNIPFSRRTSETEPPPVLPTLAETYVALARLSSGSISTLLATLADPENLPAIVFCAAGKDRTGVATALLLGALNIDDEQIVEDYSRSGVIDPRTLGDLYAQHMGEMPESYQGSDPENMRAFLAEVRREHGSVRAFVARLGFGPSRIVELERALLTTEVLDRGETPRTAPDQPTRPVT